MVKETLKQLEERRDDLMKRYVGTFCKPQSYYNCLEVINKEMEKAKSNEPCTLPHTVFDEIIEYIEETEQTIDGEWGAGRDLKELIRDKQMPELYDKLIALRNGR